MSSTVLSMKRHLDITNCVAFNALQKKAADGSSWNYCGKQTTSVVGMSKEFAEHLHVKEGNLERVKQQQQVLDRVYSSYSMHVSSKGQKLQLGVRQRSLM